MNDWQRDVLEFQRKFQPNQVQEYPGKLTRNVLELRVRLIKEEFGELIDALVAQDSLVLVADGMVDLIYVILGTAVAMGIDLNPVWQEVHHANISKTGGGLRDDGKVLKPIGWVEPDLTAILEKQGPLI